MAEVLENKISELVESVLEGTDLFLVDLVLKGQKGSYSLWVYVDAEKGGVNLDECANISEELGVLLEAHDIIKGRYRLNVSSPGVDRPLMDKRQYYSKIGRNASVKYKAGEEATSTKGIIKDFNGEELVIEKDDGQDIIITFEDIIETKILTAW
ncbi:MAG TPA: ribosome maturation factor RimP [Balneolales bacterium]|nr:ribosome maturation factor RimP [Balneolales bacterium]